MTLERVLIMTTFLTITNHTPVVGRHGLLCMCIAYCIYQNEIACTHTHTYTYKMYVLYKHYTSSTFLTIKGEILKIVVHKLLLLYTSCTHKHAKLHAWIYSCSHLHCTYCIQYEEEAFNSVLTWTNEVQWGKV